MEVIEISQATIGDAPLVSILATVTFYEAYFEQDTPTDMANYLFDSFSLDQIRTELADPNTSFFVAYLKGKAIGYAKLIANSSTDGVTGNSPIELKRIYLVERAWGTGIGKKLLAFCENFCSEKGHDVIWLGVWQENRRGQNFYAKHGFQKVGTITFPYGDSVGINDVMEKPLKLGTNFTG
ncbi:MAG TPA: GNAT family N-acetyltransferase [Pyrinomonadaceae bacterium]|nr:GNAT family N-acetyltransferase [Pyrinomonadaceae bacterium]